MSDNSLPDTRYDYEDTPTPYPYAGFHEDGPIQHAYDSGYSQAQDREAPNYTPQHRFNSVNAAVQEEFFERQRNSIPGNPGQRQLPADQLRTHRQGGASLARPYAQEQIHRPHNAYEDYADAYAAYDEDVPYEDHSPYDDYYPEDAYAGKEDPEFQQREYASTSSLPYPMPQAAGRQELRRPGDRGRRRPDEREVYSKSKSSLKDRTIDPRLNDARVEETTDMLENMENDLEMTNDLIKQLLHKLDSAKKSPLRSNKVVVDRLEFERDLQAINKSIPATVTKAFFVINSAKSIMQQAKEAGSIIITKAEQKAADMVSQTSIVRNANKKSDQITKVCEAEKEATHNYCLSVIEGLIDTLSISQQNNNGYFDAVFTELDVAKQNLRNRAKHGGGKA